MTQEIQDLIVKRHGNICERQRALNTIEDILDIMFPKFTPEADEEGYDEDEDDPGYIKDYEWSADTLEHVAAALHRNGFGPPSRVKYELNLITAFDESTRGLPEENGEEE